MVTSIFAAAITAKIGITWSTVIGSFFLSTVVFGCALSTWSAQEIGEVSAFTKFMTNKTTVIIILVLSSILTGVGQCLVWVA